jgi:hypothetical protein
VIDKKEVLPITSKTLKMKKTKRKRELIVKTNTDGPPPGYSVRKKLMKKKESAKAVPWLKL